MLAFIFPGRAMTDKPRLQLGEALDLIRTIELRCRKLRREGRPEVEPLIAELDEVVRDIRRQLDLVIVSASQTRKN